MAKLSIDQFCNFFTYYKDRPHQRLAVAELWKQLPDHLKDDEADWIEIYRKEDKPPLLDIIPGREVDNSWGGIMAAAKIAGAKFPEVVAAQWALESGWGSTPAASITSLASKVRALTA